MAEVSPQADEPDPKRRKVRKGTKNCWECRKRKVRCVFAMDVDTSCENCKRRATACNSQEYDDEPVLSGSSNQVEARLSRVETLLENVLHPDESTLTRSRSKPPLPTTATPPLQSKRVLGKYEDLVHDLTAAWPSQHDMDLIHNLPFGISAYLHSGICTPYSNSMHWDPPSPSKILQLPTPSSHTVLIARKLLVLGTFLQAVLPSSLQELADARTSYRNTMSRVVDTAIRLVTTNDDLICSVEGIECIMIEAMYHNYAGDLHHAWMAVRRAINVAEMMGLHRGSQSPFLKMLEAETRASFNPDQICFRLVEMDCYLSLMLGLPRSSLEARFATPKALEGCQPMDRMQRIHCAMADRILRRDENNLSETHEIDKLLQKAAAEMPPQWWLIPSLSPSDSGGTEVLHETMRLMDHFTHYHLLTRLHLPYMLRSTSDTQCHHSKITVVNASRETLTRYIAFRTSNPAHYYCRGTDFLAFIATTVLCLAHIDSHSRSRNSAQDSNSSTTFNSLAHSRPGDRGIMERALEILENMAQDGTDAISCKIASTVSPLLRMEADAANGTSYRIRSSKDDEEQSHCHGKVTNSGENLCVHIPFSGTIHFERHAVSQSRSILPTTSEQRPSGTLVADTLLSNKVGEQMQQPPLRQASGRLDHGNMRTGQPQVGELALPQQSPPLHNSVSSYDVGQLHEGQFRVSMDFAGVEDDWGLQGIDTTLFDSIFRDTTSVDAVEVEDWTQWASNW